MATYTADAGQLAAPTKSLRVGLTAVCGVYNAPAGQSTTIGMIFQMVKVPAGATPLYISYGTSQTGDHTLEVGDGNSSNRFALAGTVTAGQGMIVAPVAATYTYSVDDTIDMKISLASDASIGGSWYMRVIYSMDAIP